MRSQKYDKMSYREERSVQMETNLKKLRKLKKKTQLQVQMDTGIEQALLSKYESGKRIPPTETLIALADYYNVSMDYIMGRTDIPEINK